MSSYALRLTFLGSLLALPATYSISAGASLSVSRPTSPPFRMTW